MYEETFKIMQGWTIGRVINWFENNGLIYDYFNQKFEDETYLQYCGGDGMYMFVFSNNHLKSIEVFEINHVIRWNEDDEPEVTYAE